MLSCILYLYIDHHALLFNQLNKYTPFTDVYQVFKVNASLMFITSLKIGSEQPLVSFLSLKHET